ncbi:MAG TPA: leucine-rich repeat domain-containing protein [Candidatus Lokiarchaeia archaeon]|nr:leucine-rich repeat domain-containing protein [Candidatus Lokiarchaeia archaeon]
MGKPKKFEKYQGVKLVPEEAQAMQDIMQQAQIKVSKKNFSAKDGHVKVLRLTGHLLNALPDAICNLTLLEDLRINTNQFSRLPDCIMKLANLRRLHAQKNQIHELPNSIGDLKCLVDFRVDCNKLASIPDSLGHINTLAFLDVSRNKLTSLPSTLGNLTSLRKCVIWGNAIPDIPQGMTNLAQLKTLIVDAKTAEAEVVQTLSTRGIVQIKQKKKPTLPYPFKLPSQRYHGKVLYNRINKFTKVEPGFPRGVGSFVENPRAAVQFSNDLVELLQKFRQLPAYDSLEILHNVLPLRYVFILPARHGIVVFAAYSLLLSRQPGQPAQYTDLLQHLGITEQDIKKDNDLNFVFPILIKDIFSLFNVVKPFRLLLGLDVRKIKRGGPPSSLREIEHNTSQIVNSIGIMDEWKAVASPGKLIVTVGEILQAQGFEVALKFVRSVFRASEKISNILSGVNDTKFDAEKVKSLTERYLRREIAGISSQSGQ